MNSSVFKVFCFYFGIACILTMPGSRSFASDEFVSPRHSFIALNSSSPTAQCNFLKYTLENRTLICAGRDKVIRKWTATDSDAMQLMRWPSGRGPWGVIECADLNSDETRIAVGGVGEHFGAVAVLDQISGDLLAYRTGKILGSCVSSVCFSSEETILLGTKHGRVLEWNYRRRGNEKPQILFKAPEATDNDILAIAPINNGFVGVSKNGFIVKQVDKSEPSMVHPLSELTCVAKTDDGSLMALAGRNSLNACQLLIYQVATNTLTSIPMAGKEIPEAIEFSPDRQYLGVVSGNRETRQRVQVVNLTTQEFSSSEFISTGRVERITFDSTSRIISIAGGARRSIQMWDWRQKRSWLFTESEFAIPDSVRLSRDGRRLIDKSFEKISERPANSEAMTASDWTFDLSDCGWTDDGEVDSPTIKADNEKWVFVQSDDDRKWQVRSPLGQTLSIDYDTKRYGEPSCYCFVDNAFGIPQKLVVGHLWGATLFSLDDGGTTIERIFVGHNDEVTSICVHPNRKTLLTGGRDQTIKAWDIQPLAHHSDLGLALTLRNGVLAVDEIAANSPASHAGLKTNDEIVLLSYDGGMFSFDRKRNRRTVQFAKPGHEVRMVVRRLGIKQKLTLTTFGTQSPFLSFASSKQKEWIIWRDQDGHFLSSDLGQSLISLLFFCGTDTTLRPMPSVFVNARFRRPNLAKASLAKFTKTSNPVPTSTDRYEKNPRGDEPKPNLFALCVGVSDYKRSNRTPHGFQPWNDLIFSKVDALGLAKTLRKQSEFGLYDEVKIQVLLDDEASQKAIRNRLQQISKQAKSSDVVLLYLAGHGYLRPTGDNSDEQPTFYFACPKFDVRRPASEGISRKKLVELFSHLSCRKIILLDCCHSGSPEKSKLGLGTDQRLAFFSACHRDERSFELPYLGHGVFTNALIRGLAQKASICDSNQDGTIALQELAMFVISESKNSIESSRKQIGVDGKQSPQFSQYQKMNIRFGY